MPLGDVVEETWKGLCDGKTDIPVGISKHSYDAWELKRQEMFKEMTEAMKSKK